MSCETVQRRLLSLNSPQRPPAELRSHLADCPVCGQVQQRLVEIEQQVALIPIPAPPTDRMDEVIHRVLTDPTLRASVRGRRPVMSRPWPKLLAAAMVLLALGGTFLAYLRMQTPTRAPAPAATDRLLAKVMQRNVSLATAKSAREQVTQLAGMADDLGDGTQLLCRVAEASDLNRLAELYKKVVREGLVRQAAKQAQELETLEERQRALGQLAQHLDAKSEEAAKLAVEVPAPSAVALRTMAQTAKDAAQQVRALIAGRPT